MGDKFKSGQKKKLTKKEMKAINHAKLMSSKGHGSNVVDINSYKQDKQQQTDQELKKAS
jgi:hypothetical protein